ncbi:hypothetical protein BGZ58_009173 [Dissophora ornata]|nr:hypothetical protein BGZ58_009173 [Dissophora ornata]
MDGLSSSVNRTYQQEAPTSQSLMQSMDPTAISPHGSPRVAPRSAQKRREPAGTNQLPGTSGEGGLPSLDEYEEMLQKMTSPPSGNGPREPRTNLRRAENNNEARSERMARQARKLQQQQQPGLNLEHEQGQQAGSGGHLSVSAESRKLRRRSSLPTSFGELPSRVMTNLKRRSSGMQRSPSDTIPVQAQTLTEAPLHEASAFGGRLNGNRRSWEDESVAPREDLIHRADHSQSLNAAGSKFLLHADEDDDTRPSYSDESDRQRLDQQRKNRNSDGLSFHGPKPPLTTKSQLRLSHTLSQSDIDDVAAISATNSNEMNHGSESAFGANRSNIDDADRQIDQFQMDLQQLQQNGTTSTRAHAHTNPKAGSSASSSRSRATTPLDMVTEEGYPIPTGAPSRQQLLASMDDGGGGAVPSSNNRSLTPTSTRSRSTTPVASIRPPLGPAPGPAPMSMMSAPINANSGYASPTNSSNAPRKGSPAGRRVKPSPPASTSILPPTTLRPRAGSIASLSSMNSMNSIAIDSALQQAPPSLPLPSLPPPPTSAPPPSSNASDVASQRRRKASGGKELVLPTPQMLADYALVGQGQGQDSLPTPASLPSMSPDMGELASSTLASSSPNHQSQISRLKKRVSTLEKELETLGKDLSGRIRDGGELQFKVEQLTVERDALEKQVAVLQDRVFRDMDEEDPELQQALSEIREQRDMLLKECLTRQDLARDASSSAGVLNLDSNGGATEVEMLKTQLKEKEQTIQRLVAEQKPPNGAAASLSDNLDASTLLAERSFLEKEVADTRDELQRIQALLSEREQNAARDQKLREELELKLEAMKLMEETGGNHTLEPKQLDNFILQQELDTLRSERGTQRQDLDALKARLQQEEVQYRSLQDTFQRLTSKHSQLESQHADEIQNIQRNHEEVLEKVVIDHANILTDLTEQSKTDFERGFHKERQESVAREKVMKTRMEEQSVRNDMLEEKLYLQEMAQTKVEETLNEEREAWGLQKGSLERQLTMEQLQQQENVFRIEQAEKENRRLRAILADLDLVALLSSKSEPESESRDKEDMTATYENQKRQWMDQVRLLKHKMATAEAATAEILHKNMDLMVALDAVQSL